MKFNMKYFFIPLQKNSNEKKPKVNVFKKIFQRRIRIQREKILMLPLDRQRVTGSGSLVRLQALEAVSGTLSGPPYRVSLRFGYQQRP